MKNDKTLRIKINEAFNKLNRWRAELPEGYQLLVTNKLSDLEGRVSEAKTVPDLVDAMKLFIADIREIENVMALCTSRRDVR